MGMRVSDNLQRSTHAVYYSENSPAGQQRTRDAGREVTETATAVADAHVVILAVPDVALGLVSAEVVPQLKPGRYCSPWTQPPRTPICCTGEVMSSTP